MKNKKNLAFRIFAGIFVGISTGQLTSLVCSAATGQQRYYACTPAFVARIGGDEHLALALQMLGCAVLGLVYAFAALSYDQTSWSLLKQCVYFVLPTLGATLLMALLFSWVPLQLGPILSFVLSYALIFAILFLCNYFYYKQLAAELNRRI